jgi:hypothetical protein
VELTRPVAQEPICRSLPLLEEINLLNEEFDFPAVKHLLAMAEPDAVGGR